MTVVDGSPAPASPQAGDPTAAVVDMRVLRISCSRCPINATSLSWPLGLDMTAVPTCPAHTYPDRRPLPLLTSLQLAVLWLVATYPGASTVDLTSHGSPSWTVRGTSVVLTRLVRIGLVSAGQAARGRSWYLTPVGISVSAFIEPPAAFAR